MCRRLISPICFRVFLQKKIDGNRYNPAYSAYVYFPDCPRLTQIRGVLFDVGCVQFSTCSRLSTLYEDHQSINQSSDSFHACKVVTRERKCLIITAAAAGFVDLMPTPEIPRRTLLCMGWQIRRLYRQRCRRVYLFIYFFTAIKSLNCCSSPRVDCMTRLRVHFGRKIPWS